MILRARDFRDIECPNCGDLFYVDVEDDVTICDECGVWLDIDEYGNATVQEGHEEED
jgi:DNA-directed RNA polymerase subunit M/transcription elongation factor TFIIS